MPRGKKRKIVRIISEDGSYIGQMFINNHRDNTDKIKTRKKYCPKLRRRVAIKLKDEKHS